jgi:Reverse transcriptase (RNA-dependent DNA polymerase)
VDVWNGTHWFIEGDIARCFESLDHHVMLETLGEKIHDNRFLRLMGGMLSAGYLEDWKWGATLSGAPQGGVASPVLSNIYLDRLDTYVETQLLPMFNRDKRRVENPAYEQLRLPYDVRAGWEIGGRYGHCVCAAARSPARIPRILTTVGFATSGMLMTFSSDSVDRRSKHGRSSVSWGDSYVKNSHWNCPRIKR